MALPREIDPLLDRIEANYGRSGWASKVRSEWARQFATVPLADLESAVDSYLDDPDHEHPPTPAKIRGTLTQGQGADGPKGCGPRCAGGLREVTIHRSTPTGVHIDTRMCRCRCAAGQARPPLWPELAEVQARLEGPGRSDPNLLFWRIDPTPFEREDRSKQRPAPSATIQGLRAQLLGADPEPRGQAWERARTKEWADEERGGEEW